MGVFVLVEAAGCVLVAVAPAVTVRVAVAAGACVDVAVLAPVLSVTTSSGLRLPSRDEKRIASLLSAASTKVYVPLPVTAVVTLYSTQLLLLVAPLLSRAPLVRAGRLVHVMPVSVHELPAA